MRSPDLDHPMTNSIDLHAHLIVPEAEILVRGHPGWTRWAEPDLASPLVQIQNERIAEVCAAYPHRFIGLGAVALQHPELAVSQLDACMNTYLLKGVEIASAYLGRDLSNKHFEPFWELAEKLKAVILIHPMGSTLGERTVPYYFSNII